MGREHYPVLYLNDGQNLFDPATAFAGVHWQAGETATRLIGAQKIPPLIIVGIDNTKARLNEYIPYKSSQPRVLHAKGSAIRVFAARGDAADRRSLFGVKRAAKHRAGGSSLGGLIALYTHLAAPGVFGRC